MFYIKQREVINLIMSFIKVSQILGSDFICMGFLSASVMLTRKVKPHHFARRL